MKRRWLSRFKEIWNVIVIVCAVTALAIFLYLKQRRKDMKCPKCKTEINAVQGTMNQDTMDEPCQACKDEAKDKQEKFVGFKWFLTSLVALVIIFLLVLWGKEAKADHEPAVLLGKFQMERAVHCNTIQQVENIIEAYNNGGVDLANRILQESRSKEGEKVCGLMTSVSMVSAKVGEMFRQYGDETGKTIHIIRLVIIGLPMNIPPYVNFFDTPSVQYSWTVEKIYTRQDYNKHQKDDPPADGQKT